MTANPFFIWQDKVLVSVDPENIMFLETTGNYTKLVYHTKMCHMIRLSLTAALRKLPPGMFIQTHRAFAVSVHYIRDISNDHLTAGDLPVPIGVKFYKKLLAKINIIGNSEEMQGSEHDETEPETR